jgi:hypothetical protein
MTLEEFPKNRYDSETFLDLFVAAEVLVHPHGVFASFNYNGVIFEVCFEDCETIPVPQSLYDFAKRACGSICRLDNLVQHSFEQEAARSPLDCRYFQFYPAYMNIYADYMSLVYWGEKVNDEREAMFVWNTTDEHWTWKPLTA